MALPKRTTYAEEIPYWQTSKSAPESWIDKAKKEIKAVGGTILGEGFLSDAQAGRSAFLLSFQLEAQRYDAKWTVLKPKGGNEAAARRQAATALYHDVKARCVALKFHGARAAFLGWLVLPDGRTAAEASDEALVELLPMMMGVFAYPPPGYISDFNAPLSVRNEGSSSVFSWRCVSESRLAGTLTPYGCQAMSQRSIPTKS